MKRLPEVLGLPAFRNVLAARMISSLGSWMQFVAVSFIVIEETGSAAALGLVALAMRGPNLVLSGYAGVLADKLDKRRLGIACAGAQLAAAALLAVLSFTDQLPLAAIYAATVVIGIGTTLTSPALQALVLSIVPREMVGQAINVTGLSWSLVVVIGPALAGGLVVLVGAWPCFALNALSFLAVLVVLVRLRGSDAPELADARSGGSIRSLLRSRRSLAVLIAGIGLVTLVSAPMRELAAAVADRFDAGAEGIGTLVAAFAVGAVAGSAVLVRIERRGARRARIIPVSTVGFGLALALLAAAPSLPVAVVAIGLGGAVWQLVTLPALTGLQLAVPGEFSGRALGFYELSAGAGATIGPALVGLLTGAIGLGWSIAVCAIGAALLGFGVMSRLEPDVETPAEDKDEPSLGALLAMSFDDAWQPAGLGLASLLTMPDKQSSLATWIARRGEVGPDDLKSFAGRSDQSVDDVVADLEALARQGLVRRVGDDDRPRWAAHAGRRRASRLSSDVWDALD